MSSILEVKNLSVSINGHKILEDITLSFVKNKITTIIGPSGSGKSIFLHCLNRLNDIEHFELEIEGKVLLENQNIYELPEEKVYSLRRSIGIVEQKPEPFPFSIYENVIYGQRIRGLKDKKKLDEIVERSLKEAALWNEVKDRLDEEAIKLSGGQQRRLCIARTIAVSPEIILMDEPIGGLDPTSSFKIEDLMQKLKTLYTIILVTHNTSLARRVSDYIAFFFTAEPSIPSYLIEYDLAEIILKKPKNKLTEDYIRGEIG